MTSFGKSGGSAPIITGESLGAAAIFSSGAGGETSFWTAAGTSEGASACVAHAEREHSAMAMSAAVVRMRELPPNGDWATGPSLGREWANVCRGIHSSALARTRPSFLGKIGRAHV